MDTMKYHDELRALLSIRNFSKALEMHYEQLNQIEKNFDKLNASASIMIEANCPINFQGKWNISLMEVKDSIASVIHILNTLKEKVVKKDRSDSSELWKQVDVQIEKLKKSYKSSEKIGFEILPVNAHQNWQDDMCNFEATILPLIISHANACKLELKIIEKYTPKELHTITQIIFDHIPENFSFEDADKYEKEYLNAVEELRKEFSHEKNLWDKFLDVLAGGTHQPPSERVMLERWLEGEKQDL